MERGPPHRAAPTEERFLPSVEMIINERRHACRQAGNTNDDIRGGAWTI
ncbi:MAG: hypothetical protein ABII25_01360 [bacterium]